MLSAGAGPIPFSADRSLSGDSLRLRGKTAREFTIGRRLRELREQRNLTQQEMAGKAGVPRTYISRIENARLLPGPVMLHRIADALAVKILDLLPQNRNGILHGEPEQDPFWEAFAKHFLQLSPQQMSRVVSYARNLATEGRAESVEVHLAVAG
ncbi:MAG: helix-turn-helix transcriptional regulator [Acidobacteria bacterium]|nr:helix-turn-helix transcriptional regulator [Acidobacteriota bacterium]